MIWASTTSRTGNDQGDAVTLEGINEVAATSASSLRTCTSVVFGQPEASKTPTNLLFDSGRHASFLALMIATTPISPAGLPVYPSAR